MKKLMTYRMLLITTLLSFALSSGNAFAADKMTGTDISKVHACYEAITKFSMVNNLNYAAKNAMCDCELTSTVHWKCTVEAEVFQSGEKRGWHATWGYGSSDQEACDMAGNRGENRWSTTVGNCTCGDFNNERGCYILTRDK
ncbi:hypothetical protein A3758_32890 [Oleiphilus sp. HI0118]|nr:hypothetical protein A3758_17360 [Oleiphilus sp. HI0118]KZZ48501.1 hypothetical protein A3758_32890 [Oleiphilus sp. HI0118]